MTTTKAIDIKSYCDVIERELSGMKSRLLEIAKTAETFKGPEAEGMRSHVGHLRELADSIDWKMDILLKACPFDWHRHEKDFDSTTSVKVSEDLDDSEKRAAGGYVGG